MTTRGAAGTRRNMLLLLPALAVATLVAATAPSQAAPGDQSRNQQIINKADGSRIGTYQDSTGAGNTIHTFRTADYDKRATLQWALQEHSSDGTVVVRNEKNTTMCLQPGSTPASGVELVIQPCDGSEIQKWRMVREQTGQNTAATGWWSLRPASNTQLAAAPYGLGSGGGKVRLQQATNSSDRLWHHQNAGESW